VVKGPPGQATTAAGARNHAAESARINLMWSTGSTDWSML
jgi:CarD family transcriptional regulator